MPKKPNEMFHRPANDCRGFSVFATVAITAPLLLGGEAGRSTGVRQRPIALCAVQRIRIRWRRTMQPSGHAARLI
jgi:hypothetical protein